MRQCFELAECADDTEGVLDDGEVFETEKVHLEEADFFDRVVLG